MKPRLFFDLVSGKIFRVLLLGMLVFQSSGIIRMTVAAESSRNSPEVVSSTLACGCLSVKHQIIFLIDDSGSMQANDPKFNRNQAARNLVDELTMLQDIQVAVIHFNDKVIKSSAWQKVDSMSATELNDWKTKSIDPDKGFRYTKLGTDFGVALTEAQKLFEQSGLDYCTHRSIVLFSDGTPEDVKGIIKGNDLATTFETLHKLREGITRLDGLYLIGYQVNSRYLGEDIKAAWKQMITKPEVFPSGESTRAIQEIRSDHEQGKDLKNLGLSVDVATKYLFQNQQSDIKLAVALQGGDPNFPLNVENFSVTPNGQNKPLPAMRDGNNYQISWTPAAEDAQFEVKADLSDAMKKIVLSCTGDFLVPVVPPNITTTTTAGVSLVIMPPNDPVDKNKPVILPLRLNYDGEVKSVEWNLPHAQIIPSDGQPAADTDHLTAQVETVAGNLREANLVVSPVGKGAEIEAGVGALITVVSQDEEIEINIPDGTSKIVISEPPPLCIYSGDWKIWFWPLLIGLLGLMIILLVLRAGSRRDNVEDTRANRDIFRIRDWHLLFWPLPVLFILLILVPIMRWSCIIPPWLFLISLLFWLIMIGLLRFIPGQNIPRSRAWVLFVALLAIALLGFLTVTNSVLSLLWLVVALLAIGVTVWYISPYETLAPLPDDLKDLEGIGESVEEILHAHDIYTFKELAEIEDWHVIEGWLNTATEENKTKGKSTPWGKMMDPKTWPQQAKLADIAKRYRNKADKLNYEAYKAWLKDGIEPDEHNHPEIPRRPLVLPWNGIPSFTPIVLNLAVGSKSVHPNEVIVLPVQLNRVADQVNLTAIEWKVSASTLPGDKKVNAVMKMVREDLSTHELVIGPVQDQAGEIQVIIQALVNGRSIEIYYGKAVTVQVNPPNLLPDNLEDLEGIGPVYRQILNEKNIYTFSQLAETDAKIITQWLNEHGYEREDPKTWPQQAKLARIAKYGNEEDNKSYEAYKAWLNRGMEPDERDKDEKERRKEVLVWHGTAELTEKAYPQYFKKK